MKKACYILGIAVLITALVNGVTSVISQRQMANSYVQMCDRMTVSNLVEEVKKAK